MTSSPLKAAIIGCGGIANAHLQGYRNNQIEVTAITDINADALQEMAKKVPNTQAYDNYQQLLENADIDLVSICTPPIAHQEAVTAALAKNINVLCEKPIANDLTAATAIQQAAEKSSAKIMLAYRHRFLPAIIKLREIVESDQIGLPVFFHNRFCGPAFDMKDRWFTKKEIAGGGCMIDTSSHSVDLFRFIIGEVVEQSATMHRHFDNTNVEDAAILNLKAQNGCIASLTSAFVAGDGSAFIDITGQKGRAIYDYFKPETVQLKTTGQEEWQNIPVEPSDGFTEQIAAFAQAIQNNQQPPITATDGLRALEIILSTYNNH